MQCVCMANNKLWRLKPENEMRNDSQKETDNTHNNQTTKAPHQKKRAFGVLPHRRDLDCSRSGVVVEGVWAGRAPNGRVRATGELATSLAPRGWAQSAAPRSWRHAIGPDCAERRGMWRWRCWTRARGGHGPWDVSCWSRVGAVWGAHGTWRLVAVSVQ